MAQLTVVTEDIITEVLVRRLVQHIDPRSEIVLNIGRKGRSYVISKLRNFNRAAQGMKILAVIDRDSSSVCPINCIREWVGLDVNRNLVIRFAEMEAESWVMADRDAIAAFLDVPANRVPQSPDALLDAKQSLVNIARRSRSSRVRSEICPAAGATALVGPGYNAALEEFISSSWRARQAIRNSESLRRAELRIRQLLTS